MRSEAEIKKKGIEVLLKELGDIDTEIFLRTLSSDPFDYTRWQKDLWKDVSVEELSEKAMRHQEKQS